MRGWRGRRRRKTGSEKIETEEGRASDGAAKPTPALLIIAESVAKVDLKFYRRVWKMGVYRERGRVEIK